MSSVISRGAAAAREILDKRDPYGSVLLDHVFIRALLAEAFAHGALWGIERTAHAVAITGAKYRTELEAERPEGGAA